MGPRIAEDPRFPELQKKAQELVHMLGFPQLFCGEELLGQALGIARIAFEVAGLGEDETQRRALYEVIVDYIAVPPPAASIGEAA